MFKKIFEDYIEGKKLLPMLRRLFSVVFVASAAYFLLEKRNYRIHVFPFSDEWKVFDFFIHGYFIIPIVAFFFIWYTTFLIFDIPFTAINNSISLKYKRKILNISLQQEKIDETVGQIEPHLERRIPYKLKRDWYVTLYEHVKRGVKPNTFKEIDMALKNAQKVISEKVVFVGRGAIAVSLYFSFQSDFSATLYIFIIAALIVYLFVLFISFQFTELLPIAARKLQQEMEIYLIAYRKQEGVSDLIENSSSPIQ